MINKLFKVFIGLLIIHFEVSAQTCLHTDLSNKFDYKIAQSAKNKNSYVNVKETEITLYIISKASKSVIQKITFSTTFLYEDAYKDCNAVRSYLTGKNKNAVVSDYDYGDLIIADLNFDGREDIAIKSDSGGNGGPFYNYYLQNENGLFTNDKYLSENVSPFPDVINTKTKSIITVTHANIAQQRENTYKYNSTTKRWHLIKSILTN